MECRYCRAVNSEDEHRCRKCGRRLIPSTGERPAHRYGPVTTATAPALQPRHEAEARTNPAPARATAPRGYQRTLFNEVPRVMPAPEQPRPASAPRAPRPQRPAARRFPENQHALNFGEHAGRVALESQVDAVIFCDAKCASPAHRFLANALDGTLVITAVGLFAASFAVGGGSLTLDKTTVGAFAAVAALIWFFYHVLFCIAGGDTPGMRWTQLRLVDFDGQRPRREQRLQRLLASCLSVAAAFLGVIWALVDEESLTWHDHISKTFPTAGAPRA